MHVEPRERQYVAVKVRHRSNSLPKKEQWPNFAIAAVKRKRLYCVFYGSAHKHPLNQNPGKPVCHFILVQSVRTSPPPLFACVPRLQHVCGHVPKVTFCCAHFAVRSVINHSLRMRGGARCSQRLVLCSQSQ